MENTSVVEPTLEGAPLAAATSVEDVDLIAALRRGDENAFIALVER